MDRLANTDTGKCWKSNLIPTSFSYTKYNVSWEFELSIYTITFNPSLLFPVSLPKETGSF